MQTSKVFLFCFVFLTITSQVCILCVLFCIQFCVFSCFASLVTLKLWLSFSLMYLFIVFMSMVYVDLFSIKKKIIYFYHILLNYQVNKYTDVIL